MEIFILLAMIFFHIVDDYYLPGWLASAMQKSWWEKNAPEKFSDKDYLMALFMHSFSWSFMIMFPLTLHTFIIGGTWFPMPYIFNLIIHFVADDLKANKKKINLIQDQSIHLVQIVVTWILYLFVW